MPMPTFKSKGHILLSFGIGKKDAFKNLDPVRFHQVVND